MLSGYLHSSWNFLSNYHDCFGWIDKALHCQEYLDCVVRDQKKNHHIFGMMSMLMNVDANRQSVMAWKRKTDTIRWTLVLKHLFAVCEKKEALIFGASTDFICEKH